MDEKKPEVLIFGGLKPGKTAAAKDWGVEGGPFAEGAVSEVTVPSGIAVTWALEAVLGEPGRGVGVVEEEGSMAKGESRSAKE